MKGNFVYHITLTDTVIWIASRIQEAFYFSEVFFNVKINRT